MQQSGVGAGCAHAHASSCRVVRRVGLWVGGVLAGEASACEGCAAERGCEVRADALCTVGWVRTRGGGGGV